MQKFFTGDVVKYSNKDRRWKLGQQHIIEKCDYRGRGNFEYSTNLGAWFDDNDFTLVRRADAASFSELDKDIGVYE